MWGWEQEPWQCQETTRRQRGAMRSWEPHVCFIYSFFFKSTNAYLLLVIVVIECMYSHYHHHRTQLPQCITYRCYRYTFISRCYDDMPFQPNGKFFFFLFKSTNNYLYRLHHHDDVAAFWRWWGCSWPPPPSLQTLMMRDGTRFFFLFVLFSFHYYKFLYLCCSIYLITECKMKSILLFVITWITHY